MAGLEERSVNAHVEKQKSMIQLRRKSCPTPSARDLASRESRVRACPWALRLAIDGANSQWQLLFSKKGSHLWVNCFFPVILTLVFGFVCAYGAPGRRQP